SFDELMEMPEMPNNTQLYNLQDSDSNIHYIKDNFSFILWRVTPNGRISFVIENLAQRTYRVDIDPTRRFKDRHRHDYVELAYVCKGQLPMEISGNHYIFQRDEVFIIDRNCIHSEDLTNTDSAVVFLCMSETFFDEIFLSELQEEPLQEFIRMCLKKQKRIRQFMRFTPVSDNNQMYNLISQVVEEAESKRKGYDYLLKGLMMRIMDVLANSYQIQLSKLEKQRKDEILFQELEKYLHQKYKEVTIEELVLKYHYNADYFNRLIKKYTQLSFSQFLQTIRLSKAEEMLVASKLPVHQIIHEVGYQNKGYFYKIFVQRYGITPKE
ncbi:AraC family transcriptional regulator, partial [Paenibacillus riograndensis]